MSALRRIRVDADLTVDDLAQVAEVSPEQIRNIEEGRTVRPRPATLGKLARALSTEDAPVSASDIDPYAAKAA